jgi:hypothetical protein
VVIAVNESSTNGSERRRQTVVRNTGDITLVIELGDLAKMRETATRYRQ